MGCVMSTIHLKDGEVSAVGGGLWRDYESWIKNRSGNGPTNEQPDMESLLIFLQLRKTKPSSVRQSWFDELYACDKCATAVLAKLLERTSLSADEREAVRSLAKHELDLLYQRDVVQRARQGDPGAREAIARRCYPRILEAVRGYLRRHCQSRMRTEAEDLADRFWLEKLDHLLHTFDPDRRTKFTNYCHTCAIRAAIQWVTPRGPVELPAGDHRDVEEHRDPSDELIAEQEALALRDSLRCVFPGLPLRDRKAFVLRWFKGCIYREIAELLGIDRATAHRICKNALRRVISEFKRRYPCV
jgi:RNA polymerase sigma factor (sigma-70 family)